mmetsp:Transcript_119487/g.338145  ORF Transcript_119487/g.338145 Transcript_119487/m.338145 type:complete len:304 (+) Transcript_119487:45-956(+)
MGHTCESRHADDQERWCVSGQHTTPLTPADICRRIRPTAAGAGWSRPQQRLLLRVILLRLRSRSGRCGAAPQAQEARGQDEHRAEHGPRLHGLAGPDALQDVGEGHLHVAEHGGFSDLRKLVALGLHGDAHEGASGGQHDEPDLARCGSGRQLRDAATDQVLPDEEAGVQHGRGEAGADVLHLDPAALPRLPCHDRHDAVCGESEEDEAVGGVGRRLAGPGEGKAAEEGRVQHHGRAKAGQQDLERELGPQQLAQQQAREQRGQDRRGVDDRDAVTHGRVPDGGPPERDEGEGHRTLQQQPPA